MEFGSLEREIHIDASAEVVFEIVSDPAQIVHWWPDEAGYELVPGGSGDLVFTMTSGERVTVALQVVEIDAPRRFTFRWSQPAGEQARIDNSFLVTMELEPSGTGTTLRLTEVGFREQGWEGAVLEEAFRDHSQGWDYHLARLAPYVATLRASTR
jgi:uncharacterized protein YndB with AHSA1/START domain